MSAPVGSLVNVLALGQLGVGKLHKYDELGRAVVHFGGEGTRILAPKTPIARARLSRSTPVRFRTPGGETATGDILEFLIEREDGGFVYRIDSGGEVHDVWEGHIMSVGETGDPLQLLKSYRWDTPKSFFARWSMTDIQSRWYASTGGFPAMLGARIMPLGHQIYAARRVLFDRTPRFILADEVGLGKTIEAGIIVQALQAERKTFSVLVIAPGSMSRQWLTETYLRFGARAYHHIDCSRVDDEGLASLQSLTNSERIIVSTTALEAHPKLGEMLTSRRWDMVIVDEAHQIPPDHALYELIETLSRQADGLLLLSATPSKRDLTGLLGLLALVAPEAFAGQSIDLLQSKYDRQSAVWDRLNFTRKFIEAAAVEGRALDTEEIQFAAGEWEELIQGDAFFDVLLSRMRNGDATAASELIAYIQEFHRLDHRIIRTRRATLGADEATWPKRELIELDWTPSQAEAIFLNHLEELPPSSGPGGQVVRVLYQRYCGITATAALAFLQNREAALSLARFSEPLDPVGRLAFDAGPSDEPSLISHLIASLPPLVGEEDWLRVAKALASAWAEENRFSRAEALCSWLNNHLDDPDNQVLVFVQDAEEADRLADWLGAAIDERAVARFHCGIDEEDLADTAFRFQHDKRCRILVSDELGGEGRNFQNASAVVHFDIPTSCARLEQRIGRLDRVGRSADRPVLSVAIAPGTSADEALLAIHRDVFRVFDRTIGGLEFILPRLQRVIVEAYGDGAGALIEVSGLLRTEVDAALSATDEAFDLSLDATKPELDRSNALAAQIEDGGASESASTLRFWASCLGIQSKKVDDGSSEFRWSNGSLNVNSDRLKIGIGTDAESRLLCGTFQRDMALHREDLQYFAPGHDLVDTMILEAEHGSHSRVSAYLLEGFPKHRGTILLQVLGRSILDERRWQQETISAGLAARARSILWPEVVAEIMLLWDGRGAHNDVVTHAGLRSLLDQPRRDLSLKPLEPGAVSGLPYLPQLWAAIDEAVPRALESIAERRRSNAEERADLLDASFRAEYGYLRWQADTAHNATDAEAARAAISAREALVESLRMPRVELLGLALVALA
jgi:hypothetical protein